MGELTPEKTMVGTPAQITFTLLRLPRPTHPLDKYTLSAPSPPLKALSDCWLQQVVESTLRGIDLQYKLLSL